MNTGTEPHDRRSTTAEQREAFYRERDLKPRSPEDTQRLINLIAAQDKRDAARGALLAAERELDAARRAMSPADANVRVPTRTERAFKGAAR